MSDFADGIAPQRYPCWRFTTCQQRKQCNQAQKSPSWPYGREPDLYTYWNLDEGRWEHYVRRSNDGPATVPPPPPEPNAFIGFKRFVDSKLDSLNHGRTVRAQVEVDQPTNEDAWTRWSGSAAPPKPVTTGTASSDAREAARLMLRQAEKWTLDVPSDAIRALFREDPPDYATRPDSIANAMLAFGGACYFLPEIGDRLPSSKSIFRPAPLPHRWLSIDWFQSSPYSPLNIEADASLPEPSWKWRAAFKDLMTVSLDRPMHPVDMPTKPHLSEYLPGLDWVLELQLRGTLPPLLPRLLGEQKPNTPRLRFERGKKDFDQLADAIEVSNRATAILHLAQLAPRHLEPPYRMHSNEDVLEPPLPKITKEVDRHRSDLRPEPWSVGLRPAAESDAVSRLPDASNKPAKSAVLLAVQTTSETTRGIDGKVSTRTVVRRKYDDGTEEELETVHSSHDDAESSAR